MKRYWKLISMALVIILAIGTFYVGGSMASSQKPDFLLKKVSGNEEEVKNLTISGELTVEDKYVDSFYIDNTETRYRNEFTFIDQLNGTTESPEIKRLQKDYRNFMRGKEKNPALFYEDEEYVAYVNGWDFHETDYRSQNSPVHLEILDKKSQNLMTIQESLPNQGQYHYAFVEDVQKIDDQLKVLVRITVSINDSVEYAEYMEEIHLYTFDLNHQQLIEDEVLAFENRDHRVNIINDSDNLGPQKYLLLKKAKAEEVPSEEDLKPKEVEMSYILYQYETNERKELSIENQDLDYEIVSISGSTIYMINMSEAGLEIHPYEIESGKFSKARTLPIKAVENDYSPSVKVKHNKIYTVSPYQDIETDANVLVTDLNTWETLYEGKIEQVDLNKNETDYFLRLYGIYIE